MQNFLTNTLGPIFYGMGVSEADFAQYLGMCMGYVYGILIALGVLIVVLIVVLIITGAKRRNCECMSQIVEMMMLDSDPGQFSFTRHCQNKNQIATHRADPSY